MAEVEAKIVGGVDAYALGSTAGWLPYEFPSRGAAAGAECCEVDEETEGETVGWLTGAGCM